MEESQHQLVRSQSYRTMIKEFIELYREQTCLWQITHKDYFNKTKRYAAVDKLLVKYREIEPQAEHDDVLRKINTLRTTYRKEKNKNDEAAAAGSHRVSKLWCFNLLAFVDDEQERPAERQEEQQPRTEPILFKKEYNEEEDCDEIPIEHIAPSPDYKSIEVEDHDTVPIVKRIKRERVSDDYSYAPPSVEAGGKRPKLEEVQPEAARRRSHHSGEGGMDRHELFCRHLAHKLRGLPAQQRLLAEKLINEVMFEAEWGSLSLKHKITS